MPPRNVLAIALAISCLAPAMSHAQSNDGLTLRQRIEDERTNTRRTPGDRSLERTNAANEQRRRQLIRQRNSPIDSTRSVPVLPKTNRSSVVVNQ